MNVEKMAVQDANRWLPAYHLENEIANKFERLSGYADAFDSAFEKIRVKTLPAHLENMNKLRDKLDKIESASSGKGKVILVVALVGAAVAVHRAGYDKTLLEKGKAKLRLFRAARENKGTHAGA